MRVADEEGEEEAAAEGPGRGPSVADVMSFYIAMMVLIGGT